MNFGNKKTAVRANRRLDIEIWAIKRPHRQTPGDDKKHGYVEGLFHGNSISHETENIKKNQAKQAFQARQIYETPADAMRQQRTLWDDDRCLCKSKSQENYLRILTFIGRNEKASLHYMWAD